MAGRALIVASIVLVVLIGAAIVIGIATSGSDSALASLEDLREREVVFLDDEHIFLVYNGGEVLALSDDPQHLEGEHTEWCETSRMFETPTHGETFDSRGYYYGGPAQRGLDRYPVRIDGDPIYVELDQRMQGPDRGEGPAIEPQGDFCIPG
ncbi:MAG: Rieske 2Fe-2S domain-containing protein [Actinomycetota bacterium]|nr:Rieske 2Fe-2S domain-containing protein [Actinomycetota bacterium]